MRIGASGGRRATDTLEVFPEPQVDAEGGALLHFFVHGIRHSTEAAAARAEALEPGERLLLMHDLQNPFDRNALALRTAASSTGDLHLLGFCPRYLSEELLPMLREGPEEARVEVVRVNPRPAPAQMRVLCSLRLPAGWSTRLFRGWRYEPVAEQGEPVRKAG
jgi:hypothetical protein